MERRRCTRGLRGKLLEKSIEAYVLSLETINRLSIRYRVETFTYLICNAWELLLKAKLILDASDNKAIYYSTTRGEKRRTLALRDCLKRAIPDEKDAVRRNLEAITELRDEACHLVIAIVPKEILALFQACVVNYHDKLNEWFDESLSRRIPVGMMALVYDLEPDSTDLSSAKLRRQMGRETAMYLMRYQANVLREFESLGRPDEYSIVVDYNLLLTRKVAGADFALTNGPDGELTGIVEVAKDPNKSHPFLQADVLDKVNEVFTDETINGFDLQCFRRWRRIDDNGAYFWRNPRQGSPQYSQAYIDLLLKEYTRDPCLFQKAREFCKKHSRPGTKSFKPSPQTEE